MAHHTGLNYPLLLVISSLSYLTVPVAPQSQVITESWSTWTCSSSNTEALRSRVVANCTTMDEFNPMTSCINSTEVETTTDVISVSLGWSSWSPVVPSCGTTRMISQSRAIQCSMVNPQCSVTCSSREATRSMTIPLCCTALPWSQWTMWASTPCLSVATQQTRQRTRDRITCVNVNDCEDNCINGTEARTISPNTWGVWESWSPIGEQTCASGQRSRQRTCPSDSEMYCEFNCSFGDAETETDCCEEQNQWTVWDSWSEPSRTGCPATRTRARTCSADANTETRNVTQTYPCSGSCSLNNRQSEEQMIFPERCARNNTGKSSNGGSTGAAVGGAIGGVLLVIVSATVVMVVIFCIKKSQKRSSYPIYEFPNSMPQDNNSSPVYDTIKFENKECDNVDNEVPSQKRHGSSDNVVIMPNPAYEVNTTDYDDTVRNPYYNVRPEPNDGDEYECMQPNIPQPSSHDKISHDHKTDQTDPSYGVTSMQNGSNTSMNSEDEEYY